MHLIWYSWDPRVLLWVFILIQFSHLIDSLPEKLYANEWRKKTFESKDQKTNEVFYKSLFIIFLDFEMIIAISHWAFRFDSEIMIKIFVVVNSWCLKIMFVLNAVV